jgi:hypothetical protein
VAWFPNKQERDAIDERHLPAGLRDAQLAARRVPIWLRLAIILPPVAYAIYASVTFTGPYRYIALLEARLFDGTYEVKLTFLFTLIACLLPAIVVMAIVKKLYPPTAEELSRPARATAHENR